MEIISMLGYNVIDSASDLCLVTQTKIMEILSMLGYIDSGLCLVKQITVGNSIYAWSHR